MIYGLLSPMLTTVARVSSIALLTVLTTTGINNQSSYAGERKFFCAQTKGVPVTFARREDGAKIPMIRWDYFLFFFNTSTTLSRGIAEISKEL